MGTRYHITVVPPQGAQNSEYHRLKASFKHISATLNDALSTYLPTSDVSSFNRASARVWHPVGKHTAMLAELSRDLHARSRGAFDAGVGALVNMWGFGPRETGQPWQAPSDEQIAEVLERSGMRWLEINTEEDLLYKTKELFLDFSAIAKGYAVDQIADMLNDSDYHNYLVEFGGEVKSGGVNHHGKAWRIGVVAPNPDTPLANDVYYVIYLVNNLALATSGEYRNYMVLDGERYSHTIDPHSGRPVAHAWSSVTVLHHSAAYADAWATALNVMGHKDGLVFANQENLMALFIVREAETGTFRHYLSKDFPEDIAIPAPNEARSGTI